MPPRTIRAPRGTQLTCKNWLIEAPYRMLQNNLDPDVAFDPDHLIVYGGRGRAARNWECFDAILRSLEQLEPDETLLVQSGKPVAIFRTHEDAPRVLLANSNIVPAWATQENFEQWERDGLIMYGQMTAGSWIYIGTQGILQGTYETLRFAGAAARLGHAGGKLVVTAGLGEMGGAQPLAITMNGGVGLLVEVDRWRAERRLHLRQIDAITDNLEEAMTWVEEARTARLPRSIGLIGNAAEVLPELVARGVQPDVVTDQTSAHDPLYGYIPAGLTLAAAAELRQRDPQSLRAGRARRHDAPRPGHARLAGARRGRLRLWQQPAPARLRQWAAGGVQLPRLCARLHPPALLRGQRPLPLGGAFRRPGRHLRHRRAILELFPEDASLARWIKLAQKEIEFQGLPARICWLGYGERARAGLKFNELVASGAGQGAHRHRARPPGQRLGRQPQPRDRRHARRLGRHRRLAAAQRAGQCRQRRHVGQHPPRRRRGHRLQHPRRPGDRRSG